MMFHHIRVCRNSLTFDLGPHMGSHITLLWPDLKVCVYSCRDDVLPCRVHLRHCVLAAQKLGPSAYASFLDNTFLADRKTTVRQHLSTNATIMTEEPPATLTDRYSG